jgi:hypothetical protein
MIRLVVIVTILLNSVFCISQKAVFSIKEPLKKFDAVKEGEVVEHTFEFINSGDSPLIITDYSVECKCTQVSYSKEPILPGQKGFVKIIFDTHGKYLHQDRVVYLFVNTKRKVVKLRFKVFVEPNQLKK